MQEYGLFNDDSATYSEADAVEAGFYSVGEARAAILDRYSDEDGLEIHEVEEVEDEDEEVEEVEDEETN